MSAPRLPDQRAEVLAAIRRALGPNRPSRLDGPAPAPPLTPTRTPIHSPYRSPAPARSAAGLRQGELPLVNSPLETFIAAARNVGTEVFVQPDAPELDTLLDTLCAELRHDRGLPPDHPLIVARPPWTDLPTAPATYRPFSIDVTVVAATLGIATLGSVLLEAPRLPPMTAEITVALLRRDHLVATLHDALTTHPPGPTRLLVTGPSKTADIEGILITGVHGPRRFIVLVE